MSEIRGLVDLSKDICWENGERVLAVEFDWEAIHGRTRKPLAEQFADAPQTQACYAFVRRVSEWLGQARTMAGMAYKGVALRVNLMAIEDEGTQQGIADKFTLNQGNLNRELTACREFFASPDLPRYKREDESEPDPLPDIFAKTRLAHQKSARKAGHLRYHCPACEQGFWRKWVKIPAVICKETKKKLPTILCPECGWMFNYGERQETEKNGNPEVEIIEGPVSEAEVTNQYAGPDDYRSLCVHETETT